MNRPTAAELLRQLVATPSNACTPWPLSQNGRGYGQLRFDGHMRGAHRMSCLLAHGAPPTARHEAAHSCRDTSCVNPRHLRWASSAENRADKLRDDTHDRGERSSRAKLTNEEAREVRSTYAAGEIGQRELAARYGISQMAVSFIVRNKHYAEVAS